MAGDRSLGTHPEVDPLRFIRLLALRGLDLTILILGVQLVVSTPGARRDPVPRPERGGCLPRP